VTARRKGKTWYVGGLSAKRPRELELPLSFLGRGRYTANLWKDASDSESNPNHLISETVQVTARERLKLYVALDGGFVAQLTSADK